jgi:polysaccharide pyruvyl transferase CsaB
MMEEEIRDAGTPERRMVVGVSGSYGGLNVGDEAILACTTAEIRRVLPGAEVVVFSKNPAHTQVNHAVDRVLDAGRITRDEVIAEVGRLDLFLLGGGGLLFDVDAHVYLRELRAAVDLGVPALTWAIGAGPLETDDARRAVAAGLNRLPVITVREQRAKRLLEEVGVTRPIVVTADPALLLAPAPFTDEMLAREGVTRNRHLVGISVREPGGAAPGLKEFDYQGMIGHAADFLVNRTDADVLFIPMERSDRRHAHGVISRMAQPERAFVLRGEYRPAEILGLMQHLDMAVGMRLHFLIFAALARVPFVPLPYAAKVAGFLEDLDMPARTLTEEHTGRLLAHIDHSWDHRHSLREGLDRRVPGLQRRARQTSEIALQVLRTPGTAGEPTPLVAA